MSGSLSLQGDVYVTVFAKTDHSTQIQYGPKVLLMRNFAISMPRCNMVPWLSFMQASAFFGPYHRSSQERSFVPFANTVDGEI